MYLLECRSGHYYLATLQLRYFEFQMRLNDFIMTLQQKGIRWTQLLDGGNQVDPKSVGDFYSTLLNTTMGMSRRAYYKVRISYWKSEDNLKAILKYPPLFQV